MGERRDIDERDIDKLLAVLTDIQIAHLYGMSLTEVMELRRSRRSTTPPETTGSKDKDAP